MRRFSNDLARMSYVDSVRGSPIDEASDEMKNRPRRLSGNLDEKRMENLSQTRERRRSLDEKKLEEQRSRKMSVSSYITDGRVRRLSGLYAVDATEFRHRRRSESVDDRPSASEDDVSISHNLFAPLKFLTTKKDSGKSIICLTDSFKSSSPTFQPTTQYENTYRVDVDVPIDIHLIKNTIEHILRDRFQYLRYSADKSNIGHHVTKATDQMTAAVKSLKLKRYKVVSTVTAAQNTGQGLEQAGMCLWHDKKDTWVGATFQNSEMVVHGTVYLFYFE